MRTISFFGIKKKKKTPCILLEGRMCASRLYRLHCVKETEFHLCHLAGKQTRLLSFAALKLLSLFFSFSPIAQLYFFCCWFGMEFFPPLSVRTCRRTSWSQSADFFIPLSAALCFHLSGSDPGVSSYRLCLTTKPLGVCWIFTVIVAYGCVYVCVCACVRAEEPVACVVWALFFFSEVQEGERVSKTWPQDRLLFIYSDILKNKLITIHSSIIASTWWLKAEPGPLEVAEEEERSLIHPIYMMNCVAFFFIILTNEIREGPPDWPWPALIPDPDLIFRRSCKSKAFTWLGSEPHPDADVT